MSRITTGEELLEKRLLEELAAAEVQVCCEKPELPEYYYAGMPEWPHSCSLRCWGCTLTFMGSPFFVPMSMERILVPSADGPVARTAFRRLGVTCSPNCAASYLETRMVPHALQAKEFLVHLYYAMTGVRVLQVRPAPSYTELEDYGGGLSKDKFWEKLVAMDPRNSALDYKCAAAGEGGLPRSWDITCAAAPPCEAAAAQCEAAAPPCAAAADEAEYLQTLLA